MELTRACDGVDVFLTRQEAASIAALTEEEGLITTEGRKAAESKSVETTVRLSMGLSRALLSSSCIKDNEIPISRIS